MAARPVLSWPSERISPATASAPLPQPARQGGRALQPARAVQQPEQSLAGEQRAAAQPPSPWAFGVQTSERYLAWSDGATVQLLKLHCCRTLGQRMPWVDERLQRLLPLLPDLMGALACIPGALLPAG